MRYGKEILSFKTDLAHNVKIINSNNQLTPIS